MMQEVMMLLCAPAAAATAVAVACHVEYMLPYLQCCINTMVM